MPSSPIIACVACFNHIRLFCVFFSFLHRHFYLFFASLSSLLIALCLYLFVCACYFFLLGKFGKVFVINFFFSLVYFFPVIINKALNFLFIFIGGFFSL